jgi:hypothetical protein
MPEDTSAAYLRDAIQQLTVYKKLGEKAIAQVYDSGLTKVLDRDANSIALLVKHLSGNMRSRWTMFLTTDGEKPDRDRDAEFEMTAEVSREDVLQWWDDGWVCVFDALKALKPEDVSRTVTIRGQPHTVLEAINRQLMHYAYHIGQIVLLARALAGPSWKSLSIPKRPSQT